MAHASLGSNGLMRKGPHGFKVCARAARVRGIRCISRSGASYIVWKSGGEGMAMRGHRAGKGAAALCALAATIIFPAIHMEALSINPASVKQLIVTYVQNLFGRFGLFAIIYGAVAVILLALTATARSRMKRRQNI